MKNSKVCIDAEARVEQVDGCTTLPSAAVCKNARLSRDPRFDGRFVVAVLSTGIFCRPSCPARIPAERNVRYFVTAAAAAEGELSALQALPTGVGCVHAGMGFRQSPRG